MKTLNLRVFAVLLIWAALGCQAKNASLTNPPEKPGAGDSNGGALTFNFNPKVDILFVIDDSDSMKDEQATLINNIHTFVNEFAKFELIDFHIAVTRVSDFTPGTQIARDNAIDVCSKTPAPKNGGKKMVKVLTNANQIDCALVKAKQEPRGTLVTLKTVDKTGKIAEMDGPRFVTRSTPDYLNVLKNTLNVGTRYIEYGGSEWEEILHPTIGVFTNSEARETNKGFFRADAAILAVFVLTDADDILSYNCPSGKCKDVNNSDFPTIVKPVTAQDVAVELSEYKKLKGGKLLTFAGLSLGNGCMKDPALALRESSGKVTYKQPAIMMDFIKRTEGKQFDICGSNWGPELAEFGARIRKELATKGFLLREVPELGTLKVFYGDQRNPRADDEIAQYDKDGNQVWGYKVEDNLAHPRITFTDHADFKAKPNATFYATYKKLSSKKLQRGSVPFVGAH